MTHPSSSTEPETLSFEVALSELETIVNQLEKGAVTLERSIELYERGEQLKKRCAQLLQQAEARVEKIVQSEQGLKAVPFDVQEV